MLPTGAGEDGTMELPPADIQALNRGDDVEAFLRRQMMHIENVWRHRYGNGTIMGRHGSNLTIDVYRYSELRLISAKG